MISLTRIRALVTRLKPAAAVELLGRRCHPVDWQQLLVFKSLQTASGDCISKQTLWKDNWSIMAERSGI